MNPLGAVVEWAVSNGPPNWVFVLALITHPATWSDAALKRLRPLLDRVLPARGESKGGASGE